MFDLSKFAEYPTWVKLAALAWIVLTLILSATLLFLKPDQKNKAKLKEPKFGETIEEFSFSVGEGGFSVGYKKESLGKKHQKPFSFFGYQPVELYIEDGQLYADVKIYGGRGLPPIEIKKNKLSNKPHDWDFNSNDKALEIVDNKQTPIYQFFYKTPSHIVINGIFPSPGGLILANENGATINTIFPTNFSLKRIFKYPSWQYPGEYEKNR
jgi:hypothetical protein